MRKCLSTSSPLLKQGLVGFIKCFDLSKSFRHIELEAELKREEKVRTLKKNLKLLMIALIVLAIEKLSEFLTALFSGQASGNTVKIDQIVGQLLVKQALKKFSEAAQDKD